MTSDDPSQRRVPPRAQSEFEEFLARRQKGDDVDFVTFCAGHPSLKGAIGALAERKDEADLQLLQMILSSGVASDKDVAAGLVDFLSQASGSSQMATASRSSMFESGSVPGAGKLGPYKILEPIGEGGFGVVYLAEQQEPVRRRVALKVIKLGMDTKEVVARFDAERQALAMMDHPNVAKVLDAGSTGKGRPYFVMEYVRGVSLTEYSDRHILGTRARLELFVAVCDAIQHAHHKGIIHRDLKPSNILVMDRDEERVPKVIDFGIAKAINQPLTEHSVYTQQGVLIGTPEYMSPEQAEMTTEDVDTRADIYSLGVVLYELLSGALPFQSKELRQGGLPEIHRMIREVTPLRPSSRLSQLGDAAGEAARKRDTDVGTLVGQLRGDLDWIAMKAMEKDRMRRYASASELAADVVRHLRDQPVLAGPPSTTYRLKKFYRRHRLRIWAAATVALLLGAFTIVGWYVSERRAYTKKQRASEQYLNDGHQDFERYRSKKTLLEELETAWAQAQDGLELWQPVWERQAEIDAWGKFSRVREEVDRHYSDAVLAFSRAVESSPDADTKVEPLGALEEAYWIRFQEAEFAGGVTLGSRFYRSLIQSLDLNTYADQLEGHGLVSIESKPAEADVYCFRYVESETRLVPLPFDPERGMVNFKDGLLGEPFLEVSEVLPTSLAPFRVGDRIVSIGGEKISLRGDIALAVKDLEHGEEVQVELLRSKQSMVISWTPFSMDRGGAEDGATPTKGRVIDIRRQFGIAFAGYPLDFVPGCRIGTTRKGRPLKVHLPKGSYLFVFRRQGFVDTRYPVAVPSVEQSVGPHLLRKSEIPQGFVYIPAGLFGCGGDSEAFQSLERDDVSVDDYFIGRLEVTVGEYLEFVNDLAVFNRIDGRGLAEPVSDAVRADLPRGRKVVLIPSISRGTPRWIRDDEKAQWLAPKWDELWPIFQIPHFAAREYCHWRSEKEEGPWRYRLPTDLEWEKAARGVDRRTYVWGDYLVWNFCLSHNGRRNVGQPGVVALVPIDESVFGVRDLAGSVEEHTLGRPVKRFRFRARRGGGFYLHDAFNYRIATRNGLIIEKMVWGLGFRVVAERKESRAEANY